MLNKYSNIMCLYLFSPSSVFLWLSVFSPQEHVDRSTALSLCPCLSLFFLCLYFCLYSKVDCRKGRGNDKRDRGDDTQQRSLAGIGLRMLQSQHPSGVCLHQYKHLSNPSQVYSIQEPTELKLHFFLIVILYSTELYFCLLKLQSKLQWSFMIISM